MEEQPLTIHDIRKWATNMPDEGQLYCPYCLTKLVEISGFPSCPADQYPSTSSYEKKTKCTICDEEMPTRLLYEDLICFKCKEEQDKVGEHG